MARNIPYTCNSYIDHISKYFRFFDKILEIYIITKCYLSLLFFKIMHNVTLSTSHLKYIQTRF